MAGISVAPSLEASELNLASESILSGEQRAASTERASVALWQRPRSKHAWTSPRQDGCRACRRPRRAVSWLQSCSPPLATEPAATLPPRLAHQKQALTLVEYCSLPTSRARAYSDPCFFPHYASRRVPYVEERRGGTADSPASRLAPRRAGPAYLRRRRRRCVRCTAAHHAAPATPPPPAPSPRRVFDQSRKSTPSR